MMRIAVGPVTESVSWSWVGLGLVEGLAGYGEVSIFRDFTAEPPADLTLCVKYPPPASWLRVHENRGAVVFLPIDRYSSPEMITSEADMIGAADVVLVHSEAMLEPLSRIARKIDVIEHHARDALPGMVPYRQGGFALYVGALEHVPHLLHWVARRRSSYEVRILTNLADRHSRIAAHGVAHQLGFRLSFGDGTINDVAAETWTPDRQAELMRTCSATLDVKGTDFAQATKPPTKGQQFVVSGIPFACNRESATFAYFRRRGLELAEPDDELRLLSRGYWEETERFGRWLRPRLSLGAVTRDIVAKLAAMGIGGLDSWPAPRHAG